jgi:hypothetical protein
MTTEELEQIAKLLEPIKKDLAHTNTALEALAAGQQDIRANMATKTFVETTVETAKIELKADNFTYFAPIARKVQSHQKRLDNAGIPNPEKH